jgi:F420-dependent oxidoreductase-like protein
MKFGVMIEGQEDVTWERWFQVIDLCETLGFESLWRSDHLASVIGVAERETLALWPSLTAVGLRSTRLVFGQLVSPITFRHPVELAQNAVALDRLFGGRYRLGLGAGWYQREHEAFGFPLPTVHERMDRLEEAITVVKRLWTGEPVTFAGQFYQLREARLRPTPLRPEGVPLVVGGGGEKRLLRIAAAHASDWNAVSVLPATYPAKVAALERHCAEIGRDPREIERSWMVGHLVGRDEVELRERAARLQRVLVSLQGLSPTETVARLRERGWLVGTPPEILDQVRERAALGVDRLMLQTFDLDDLEPLGLIATQVMPAFAG